MAGLVSLAVKEKRLAPPFSRLLFAAAFLLFAWGAGAQATPSVPQRASATVWIFAESVPGGEPFLPREELKILAAFVLSGLVFGWRFEYVPAEPSRGVQESFFLEPIATIDKDSERLSLSKIEWRDARLYCRAEYAFDEAAVNSARLWSSVVFRPCGGRGYGERSEETAGILSALEAAAKNAIHEHARSQVKTRPKEIRGEIKLKDEPHVSAASGRFVADAAFLINVKEIVPYTMF